MKLTLEAINQAIAVLFFVCYAYQFVYIPCCASPQEKAPSCRSPASFCGAHCRPQ